MLSINTIESNIDTYISKINKNNYHEKFVDLKNNINMKNKINEISFDSDFNKDDLKEEYCKNLSYNDIENDLYEYHMLHKEIKDEEKIKTIDEIKNKLLNIVNCYNSKIKCYGLEDIEWNLHTSDSKLFKIEDNTIIFSNSLKKNLLNDTNTILFITNLVICINKYLVNHKADYESIYDYKKEINWILIKIK